MPSTRPRRSSSARFAFAVLALFAAVVLAGSSSMTAAAPRTSGSAAVAATSAAPKPATIRVTIADMAFTPAAITAHPGDTILWINTDVVDHSATATTKMFDVTVPAGKTARFLVRKPGAFSYYCRFHPNMTGKIAVK